MSSNPKFIPALESLKHLRAEQGIEEKSLPLEQLGTTYVMAQCSCWLDSDNFIVGRWDGSLSIFDKTTSQMQGARITIATNTPSDQGVQMVARVGTGLFVTSNDNRTITLWQAEDSDYQKVSIVQLLVYESKFGIANSASCIQYSGASYLVTGHESGFLLIWKGDSTGKGFALVATVDLTSAHPTNPWNLQNIRGVNYFYSEDDSVYAVTGSENGLICVVRVPDGQVMSRTVFNPSAKRGINSISMYGGVLLVGNCSVGDEDKNLWAYRLSNRDFSVKLLDSVNLEIDATRVQVFNFCVTWGWYKGILCWYSATEEGALWMGTVENGKVEPLGYQVVAVADLGATLAATSADLSYVAYNVNSFNTNSSSVAVGDQSDPNFPMLDATEKHRN